MSEVSSEGDRYRKIILDLLEKTQKIGETELIDLLKSKFHWSDGRRNYRKELRGIIRPLIEDFQIKFEEHGYENALVKFPKEQREEIYRIPKVYYRLITKDERFRIMLDVDRMNREREINDSRIEQILFLIKESGEITHPELVVQCRSKGLFNDSYFYLNFYKFIKFLIERDIIYDRNYAWRSHIYGYMTPNERYCYKKNLYPPFLL
jgi:hypothetical protein